MSSPIIEPDLVTLGTNVALEHLVEEDLRIVYDHLDQMVFAPGTTVVREQDAGDDMYFVLEGTARIERRGLALNALGPGNHFGELALLAFTRRAATVVAVRPLRVARLSRARYLQLSLSRPQTALRLLEALLGSVADNLVAMTDNYGLLLGDRLLPRRTEVSVACQGVTRSIPTGTPVATLLPPEIDGHRVVACVLDSRPVSLATRVVSDAWISPLTLATSDGREVFRRSAGLLLLEAANHILPGAMVRLGPGLDTSQRIEADLADNVPAEIAARLQFEIDRLIAARVLFREETWTVEEARAELTTRSWTDAAAMLESWRDEMVTLVSCGWVYALRTEPAVLDTGVLEGVTIGVIEGDGLVLQFGPGAAIAQQRPADAEGELEVEARVPRWGGEMVAEQRPWHRALGVTSVGEFNRSCVSGKVAEIIRVAEGFHEKRLGRLADAIVARADRLRVIAIAGPSSSGKTTLIKRLITQLEVVGLRPYAVSLDDYYVDRERTPRDTSGEYDFECLEALDLVQLQADLRLLLRGERVRPPRFDFKLGKSLPGTGPELHLDGDGVLLLEGIHGLNPALVGDAVPPGQQYRVFIHPATGLPIDRLSRVSPYDLRLLRRIVRDRHTRNISAAENIARWPSVRRGESLHIYPYLPNADTVFDSSLVYEPSVIKVFAERYLLEVPSRDPAHTTAHRLRQLVDRFVAIYPDHVPPTSILREFIGGSGFEY
ncbi:MAG: cyclic nucleotide-binding domain-containing protein [Myxococcales bacterium]|nr:cyclic nucleotide-binding domain-containing protein [Myxococcales bacterium]